MRVLFVTSEIYPLIKTGGLGDVAAALPAALIEQGVDIRVLVPGYPSVLEGMQRQGDAIVLGEVFGHGDARLIPGRLPDSDVFLWALDIPTLYNRPGNPYLSHDGRDWGDNAIRFAALSRVAALIAEAGGFLGWRPDVLHANDWQAGLASAYLHFSGNRHCKSIITVHNIQFQGNFPARVVHEVGLPASAMHVYGAEFYGQFSFLKAGLFYSNWLTTVSPTYANEICTPAYSFGMDGLLQDRVHQLHGILNGIDYHAWNPETDPLIPHPYSRDTLENKLLNKRALQQEMGLLVEDDRPLFGLVSRLTEQKGIDLILEAIPAVLSAGAQLVVLGSGHRAFEDQLRQLAAQNPLQVAVHIGYDEIHSHRIQAGVDILLVPSRFEPCGLTQLYAMRYGTLPLVRRTGGLADSVTPIHSENHGTGFLFDRPDTISLLTVMLQAMGCLRNPTLWRNAQQRAMSMDFGWRKSARAYMHLYESGAPPVM
ncbi:glycogen synthase (ADP-glucose) [Magnetococcus marinus MC-1]|uniref:Glycogen synthase n=1 Tax=Magnetococcus marinus (strain ATCC BAA-1437 / JCM 17883 / MC-1) TaxID=156889 RepID=A0L7T7_MAGMM|nr:glycogen synthase GlgA [Magnetococcus marinus]ABK44030.1 glycogen synthase (ADP-glucose) [Magnetococcus marinus MC-1]